MSAAWARATRVPVHWPEELPAAASLARLDRLGGAVERVRLLGWRSMTVEPGEGNGRGFAWLEEGHAIRILRAGLGREVLERADDRFPGWEASLMDERDEFDESREDDSRD